MSRQIDTRPVLIIQTAFLGDVILTTPLITVLRAGLPDSAIDFLTIPNSRNVVESNPAIRQVILFDKRNRDRGWQGLRRIGRLLAENRYSICITPHRSWRSAYLTRCTAAPVRLGFNTSAWSGVFTQRIRYRNDRHEIDRNLSLLEPLHIPAGPSWPVLYPTVEDQTIVTSFLQDVPAKSAGSFFAVAPGSIWPTKRWPAENYKIVISRLIEHGLHIMLIGSGEDTDVCAGIAANHTHCTLSAGKFSIRQTFQLLRSCKGLLTNDSAPAHLGLAAAIPVFTIFGPTVPEFGFAPLGENGYIFENRRILCRPCGIHGGMKCPLKTFACMKQITPQQVADQIIRILAGE
jgi:heptosyltransferase-2